MGPSKTILKFILWILALQLPLLGCGKREFLNGEVDSSDDARGHEAPTKSPEPSPDPVSAPDSTAEYPCPNDFVPAASIRRTEDLVQYINDLPKPLSLTCFLKHLPRPLQLTATSSRLSIQPAEDASNPRIFVFLGDLVLAVVPAGGASHLLEWSEFVATNSSVKGEILFPVKESMGIVDVFKRSLRDDGISGSRCNACHGSESLSTDPRFENQAFASRPLRPLKTSAVSLSRLTHLRDECGTRDDQRCEMLRALLGVRDDGNGSETAVEKQFPDEIQTLF